MRILLVGKSRYTNKETIAERFGRIYRLPESWSRSGAPVRLELLDYRQLSAVSGRGAEFPAVSRGALNPVSWFARMRAARRFAPEAVIGSGDCFVGLEALRIARAVRAPFIFDVYDDYRSFGGYRLFAGWDAYGYLLRESECAWFASRRLRGDAGGHGLVVPNGVDTAVFYPRDMRAARVALGLPNEGRLIGYFGSLEPERGVPDLVEALDLVRRREPTAQLLVCGGHPGRSRIDHPHVIDRGNVPHAEVAQFIAACDVVTLPYRRGPTIDAASSLKMAEYLFCERPIAATATPGILENFPRQVERLHGRLAAPSDPASLAEVLIAQLEEPRLAEPPRSVDWDSIAAKALASLHELRARDGRD
jgi:glycosyltransferase involved in cell wall biosynthesis